MIQVMHIQLALSTRVIIHVRSVCLLCATLKFLKKDRSQMLKYVYEFSQSHRAS